MGAGPIVHWDPNHEMVAEGSGVVMTQLVSPWVCCGGCFHHGVISLVQNYLRQVLGVWQQPTFCCHRTFVFDLNPDRA